MRNGDTSYKRYLRAEAELTEQLQERRRVAEEAAAWERIRQFMRERGSLEEFEVNLRDFRRLDIRSERSRGKSLRDAILHADGVIARVRKYLIDSSPVCREYAPPSS